MIDNFYYTPPEQWMFDEMKAKALILWRTMCEENNSHESYLFEKTSRIMHLPNEQDNFMYIAMMFDIVRQKRLAYELSPETRQAVRDRLIAGGATEPSIVF